VHGVDREKVLPGRQRDPEGVDEQRERRGPIAGGVEDASALEQIPGTEPRGMRPQEALHTIKRAVRLLELLLQPLGPGDLGQDFCAGLGVRADAFQKRPESALALLRLVEVPECVDLFCRLGQRLHHTTTVTTPWMRGSPFANRAHESPSSALPYNSPAVVPK